MKTIIVILIATLAALIPAGQASAERLDRDTRHCVVNEEVWHTSMDLNRTLVERKWEVTGKGYLADIPGFGRGWVYPMCDTTSKVAFAVYAKYGVYAFGTFQ